MKATKIGHWMDRHGMKSVHLIAHSTWCAALSKNRRTASATSGRANPVLQVGSVTVNLVPATLTATVQLLTATGTVYDQQAGPVTFANVPDGEYTVVIPSIDPVTGDTFEKWSDGLTTTTHTVTVTFGTSVSLTATYNVVMTTPPPVNGTLNVTSTPVLGVPVTVSQNGVVVWSWGTTPYTQSMPAGTYQVTVPTTPFAGDSFQQWSDGSASSTYTITMAAGGTVNLTAQYNVAIVPVAGGGTIQFAYFDISTVGASVFINAKNQYPSVPMIVVINPSNGPLPVTAAYQNVIAAMHNAGIKVYGYVDTCVEGGNPPQCTGVFLGLNTVHNGITGYNGYGIDGIFFDNADAWGASNWQSLQQYAQALGYQTIGNAGTLLAGTSYAQFLNYWVISENPSIPGQPIQYTTAGNGGLNASQFMIIAYAEPSYPSSTIAAIVPSQVGWINVSASAAEYTSPNKLYLLQTMAQLAGGGSTGTGGTGTVTVASVDQNGATLTGYYVALFSTPSTTGTPVASGFTPATMSVPPGTYYLEAESYTCTFTNWTQGGAGATNPFPVNVVANNTSPFTAQYLCSGGTGSGGTTAGLQVQTWDTLGNPLTGLYIQLLNSSGVQVTFQYSPAGFTLMVGSTYTVEPNDFGNMTFAYWYDNQSAVRARTVVGGATTSLIAVYNVS